MLQSHLFLLFKNHVLWHKSEQLLIVHPEFVVLFEASFILCIVKTESFICSFYSGIFAASPSSIHSCFMELKKPAYFLYICMQTKEGSLYWCHSSLQLLINGFAKAPLIEGWKSTLCVYLYRDVYMECGGTLLNVNLPCQWKDWEVLCLFIHLYKSIYTRMYMCVYR